MLNSAVAHHHSVQFYGKPEELIGSASQFLGDALRLRRPIVVVATPDHGRLLLARLADEGIDVEVATSRGELTHLDADETLGLFMRAGQPDADLFGGSVGRLIREVLERHAPAPLRAYGEMVDVLWGRGESAAALALEELWNDLANQVHFELLCGYSMTHFYQSFEQFQSVCLRHSHIVQSGLGVPMLERLSKPQRRSARP